MNRQQTRVYKQGRFVQCHWQNVAVGDIVLTNRDETFPADLLLLSSASPDGTCFVETLQLDGEKNLKMKHVPARDLTLPYKNLCVICEAPNKRLYEFDGSIDVENSMINLSIDNILMRVCLCLLILITCRDLHYVIPVTFMVLYFTLENIPDYK
jgi:P-type E1-E2 ATPase